MTNPGPFYKNTLVEKEKISDILLLFVALIWGLNFVAIKILLGDISPVNLILFRFFVGSSLLFLLLFFRRDVKMPLKDFYYLCGLGFIGITTYQLAFVYALKYTSVASASILINTAPLYSGIIVGITGLEEFPRRRFLPIMTGFAGVYIIITKGTMSLSGGDARGNLLAAGASILWAFYTLLSKPLLDRHSPLKVTAYSMISGSVLLIPLTPFFFNIGEYARLSWNGWALLLFAIIFSIVIAFVLWYWGVSRIGPSRTIIYQYSIPVFAVFFAWLFLKETLCLSQLVGAIIVFTSIALARRV